jgi:hypothetical protein
MYPNAPTQRIAVRARSRAGSITHPSALAGRILGLPIKFGQDAKIYGAAPSAAAPSRKPAPIAPMPPQATPQVWTLGPLSRSAPQIPLEPQAVNLCRPMRSAKPHREFDRDSVYEKASSDGGPASHTASRSSFVGTTCPFCGPRANRSRPGCARIAVDRQGVVARRADLVGGCAVRDGGIA